jgi:hypothetical protein
MLSVIGRRIIEATRPTSSLYKYYANQGQSNCLDLALRDFSRQKTTKVNLKTDQRKILRYIEKRIKDYMKRENCGPGRPDDPITLMTMASQFEQAGWVALVFDTRPDAGPDGEWNAYIEEDAIEFDQWCEAWERLCEEGTEITVTCHDGSKRTISSDADTERLGA